MELWKWHSKRSNFNEYKLIEIIAFDVLCSNPSIHLLMVQNRYDDSI